MSLHVPTDDFDGPLQRLCHPDQGFCSSESSGAARISKLPASAQHRVGSSAIGEQNVYQEELACCGHTACVDVSCRCSRHRRHRRGGGTSRPSLLPRKAAGLVDTLKGPGPFTVFAPTDEAFAKLPAGTVENLLKPENKAKLTAILTYHVVPGKAMAKDVGARPRQRRP